MVEQRPAAMSHHISLDRMATCASHAFEQAGHIIVEGVTVADEQDVGLVLGGLASQDRAGGQEEGQYKRKNRLGFHFHLYDPHSFGSRGKAIKMIILGHRVPNPWMSSAHSDYQVPLDAPTIAALYHSEHFAD